MRYLADTHAVLWWLSGNTQLPVSVRAVMADDSNTILVSAASAWEITTKHRLGKLPEAANLASDVERGLRREGFSPLTITMSHAENAGRLDRSHNDPFDRLLIAQALAEGLILISNEAVFDRFGVQRVW